MYTSRKAGRNRCEYVRVCASMFNVLHGRSKWRQRYRRVSCCDGACAAAMVARGQGKLLLVRPLALPCDCTGATLVLRGAAWACSTSRPASYAAVANAIQTSGEDRGRRICQETWGGGRGAW